MLCLCLIQETLKKWITAYNKDHRCFDEDVLYDDFYIISDSPINNNNDVNYDALSYDDLKTSELKKDHIGQIQSYMNYIDKKHKDQ